MYECVDNEAENWVREIQIVAHIVSFTHPEL